MRRNLFLIVLMFVIVGSLFSYTTISGSISGTFAAGTYYVSGDIYVDENTTLTLQQNVIFKFDHGTGLYVRGTLITNGADENEVVFISKDNDAFGEIISSSDGNPSKGDWYGIEFFGHGTEYQGIANMTYSKILYAGRGNGSSLKLSYSDSAILNYVLVTMSDYIGISVNNCSPQFNNGWVAYSNHYGVEINNSNPVFNNYSIGSSTDYAIYINDYSSKPQIKDTYIHHTSGNPGIPIALAASQVSGLSNLSISDNVSDKVVVYGNTISEDSYWRKMNTYYEVMGYIIVTGTDGADNVTTLTIQEGTTLKFENNSGMYIGDNSGPSINGAIIANGTSTEPITFTSAQASPSSADWSSLLITQYADSNISSLNYCNFSYGGDIYSSSLNINDNSLSVSNVTSQFSDNGINLYNSNSVLNNCNFDHNIIGIACSGGYPTVNGGQVYSNVYGALCTNSSSPTFDGVTIYSNSYEGIELNDVNSSPIIQNCVISDNGSYPISFYLNHVAGLSNNTFQNNTLQQINILGQTLSTDLTMKKFSIPYRIESDISVFGTDGADNITTLTIEAGTTLLFADETGIQIGHESDSNYPGALRAIGTDTDHITFTSISSTPTAGLWAGIYFANYSDDTLCRLEFCDIAYGGFNAGANIKCMNASPSIHHSTMEYNSYYGVDLMYSSAYFNDCIIQNNASGLRCAESNCTFNYGGIVNNTGYGAYVSNTSNPSFLDCDISYNGNIGLVVMSTTSEISVNSCRFENNFNFPIQVFCNQVLGLQNNTYNTNTYNKVFVHGGLLSQDAEWENPAIPFYIYSDIFIQGQDGTDNVTTLILEPGTTLQFNDQSGISVGTNGDPSQPGALVAEGTLSDNVTFTTASQSPSAGLWDGIYFADYSDDTICMLKHCNIYYGGFQSFDNIYCYQSSPQLQNINTQQCDGNGITLDGSDATIDNVTSQYNTFHGIHAINGSNPTILNCSVTNNTWYGILINTDCSAVVTDNNINNNAIGGLCYGGSNSGFVVANNTFTQNGNHPIFTVAPAVPYIYGNTYSNNAQNSILVDGGTVSLDATWQNQGIPYNILNTVYVQGTDGTDNVTVLEIAAGTELQFGSSGLQIGHDSNSNYTGALRAIGTTAEPIKFTSNNTSPGNGDWDRIYFADYSDDSQNIMSNCIVEYGGSSYPQVCFNYSAGIIQNSVFRFSGNSGISCMESSSNLSFLECYNNSQTGIEVHGGFFTPTLDHITSSNNNYGFDITNSNNPSITNSISWYNMTSSINILGGINVNISYSNFEQSQTGIGNISFDPGFKDPWGYDYNLAFYSPCIDTGDPNSTLDPDGSRTDMGANFFDSTNGKATITSVDDVPNDQGLQVHVIWDKCGFDTFNSSVAINQYSVWRNDNLRNIDEKYLINNFKELLAKKTKLSKDKIYIKMGRDILTFVTLVPAMGFEQYAIIAPTLKDSSSTGNNAHQFTVYSHTEIPALHYASSPEAGYSVDNIAPNSTRVTLAKQNGGVKLTWDKVEYGEFEGNLYPEKNGIWYNIYSSDEPNFNCDGNTYLATTTNLEYLANSNTQHRRFYKIVVSDQP